MIMGARAIAKANCSVIPIKVSNLKEKKLNCNKTPAFLRIENVEKPEKYYIRSH